MSFTYDKCNDIPSKGGMSAKEVKDLAQTLGIDVQGKKKNELCQEILAKRTGQISKKEHDKNVVEKQQTKIIVKPLIKDKDNNKYIDKDKEQKEVIAKLLKELDHLVTTSKNQLECCLEHYNDEIHRLSKKFRKTHKGDLETIADKFLIPYIKQYSDFYFTYVYLEKVSEDKLISVDYISDNLVKLVDEYVRLLHSALSNVEKEFLYLLFPPTNEYVAIEEHSEICKTTPALGKSYLNCIRTYMMQIISRYNLLAKELLKQVSKIHKEDEKIYKTSAKLVEITGIAIKVLDQMSSYIDSITQCREDYCSVKFCTKKAGKFFGSQCSPKYPGYLDKDWVKKTYLSHLL